MGLPALSVWETFTDSSPKLLFHDDNQGVIGVVRSGRNPTMRHLERTHEISITSLHEHFSKDHFVLMYEITAKMAADIHTKGFTNPLAWKKACMLINLLDPEDLGSKQLGRLSPGETRSPIFHTLKHPYCHLRCIVRVFQVETSFKNYLVWILYLWSRFQLCSEQDRLVSSFLRIASGAPGSWSMGSGSKLKIVFHHCYNNHGLTNGIERGMFSVPSSHFCFGCLTARARGWGGQSQGRSSMGFQRSATMESSHLSLTFGTETLFETSSTSSKDTFFSL